MLDVRTPLIKKAILQIHEEQHGYVSGFLVTTSLESRSGPTARHANGNAVPTPWQ